MRSTLKNHGQIILAVIGALAIIGTSWWTNSDGENSNAWLYVFCIWLILYSILEVYLQKKKDKDR